MSERALDLRSDRHRPAEWEHLGALLGHAYLAGHPGQSNAPRPVIRTPADPPEPSHARLPQRNTHHTGQAPPDTPDGALYRRIYDKYRKRCAELARELEIELNDGRPHTGGTCPKCSRGARYGARYCDRCAAPLQPAARKHG